MSGAFTKPQSFKSSWELFLKAKKYKIVTDFFLGEVDNDNKKILDFGGT